MQRLSAARRLAAGAVDRQIALGGFALVAIGLVCAVAFASAPLSEIPAATPVPGVSERDPVAARDLVDLMRAGERGRWFVKFAFTRTLLDGPVLRQLGEEARSRDWHVAAVGTAMTIEHGDESSVCDVVGDDYGCQDSPGGPALPESTVVRVVVATRAYNVVRRPDATIAGQRARCFRMRATGQGSLPDFGVETTRCLSPDGIPLRLVVVRPPGNVEERVAVSVRRDTTVGQVKALALARESAGRRR